MPENYNEELRTEMLRSTGNVSINFKYFKFRTYDLNEQVVILNYSFPKYRSFEGKGAPVFYKHISRMVDL